MESHVSSFNDIQVGSLVSNSREVDVYLFADKVFKLHGDRRGDQIVCQKGWLWVTQAGDAEDYVLKVGDKFIVTRPGLVVIQGVREGRAHIIPQISG